MTWKFLLILALVNSAYLIFGAAVFKKLEEEQEGENRMDIRDGVNHFLSEHDCVSRKELDQVMKMVVKAFTQGILTNGNVSSSSNWDLASSIFFSGTVVTTIGYGYYTPSTTAGRIFCSIYAIVGIPVMMVMLAGIGEKLCLCAARIDQRIEVCQRRPKVGLMVRFVIIVCMGAALFLLVPSAVFSALEGWSFGESLYYAVVSLSTIGFGDYVAGMNEETAVHASSHRDFYHVCLCLWTITGLSWLAAVLTSVQHLIKCFISKCEETMEEMQGDAPSAGVRHRIQAVTAVDGGSVAKGNSLNESVVRI